MKKNIIIGMGVLGLLLAGCSSKVPNVQTQSDSSQEMSHDMHSHDHNSVGISDSDKLNMLISDTQSQVKSVYFDFDKFNIKADQQGVVNANTSIFSKEDTKTLSIKLEGNCDEYGSDEYNYALGLKRAKSVKDALVRNGINENRIVVVSYGESKPVCTDKTKTCNAQNRRVDFKVLP